jgi:predicted GIY-YIG superfamily endonuclease
MDAGLPGGDGTLGTVYLIHFSEPYKHARHYTGWSTNLKARLRDHGNGHGARLMEVLKDAGIGWELSRTWENVDRNFERRLKRRGGAARICPICVASGNAPKH